MSAVVVWTWVGVVVLGLVVLGFCGYELVWKLRRLARDVERLQQVGTQLAELKVSVGRAQATVATIAALRAPSPASGRTSLVPARADA